MSFGEDIAALVDANSFGVLSIAPGWPRVPLGSVAKVINGFAFKSNLFRNDNGIPLIRIRDVVRGQTETFYDGPVPDGYWVDDGDLVVGMDGDFNAALWSGGRALLNQRVCRIKVDDRHLCLRFLSYLLPGYLALINAATSSITVKHLSSKTLQLLPIPLPDRDRQRRIVARVDALFAEIEEGEQALAEARAGVETYRKSLLKAAVTGELTADWRSQAAKGRMKERAEGRRPLTRSQSVSRRGRHVKIFEPDTHKNIRTRHPVSAVTSERLALGIVEPNRRSPKWSAFP